MNYEKFTIYEMLKLLKRQRNVNEKFKSDKQFKAWAYFRITKSEKKHKIIANKIEMDTAYGVQLMKIYEKDEWEVIYNELLEEFDKRSVKYDNKNLILTSDIIYMLNEAGIYLNSPNQAIKYARTKLNIEPVKKSEKNNECLFYKQDVNKIINYFSNKTNNTQIEINEINTSEENEKQIVEKIEQIITELRKENVELKREVIELKEKLKNKQSKGLIEKLRGLIKPEGEENE